MADTEFTDGETVVRASWLNAVNDFFYTLFAGATTASGARTAIGAAASGANSDITSLSGITTPLSIAQGGTGNALGSGWVPIVTRTLSSPVSSTSFSNGTSGVVLDSTYKAYMFVLENLAVTQEASGNYLYCQLGYGASVIYASSGYQASAHFSGNSTVAQSYGSGTTSITTLLALTPSSRTWGTASGEVFNGTIFVPGPSVATNTKHIHWNITGMDDSGVIVFCQGAGGVSGTNNPLTGVRIGGAVGGSSQLAGQGSISLYGLSAGASS